MFRKIVVLLFLAVPAFGLVPPTNHAVKSTQVKSLEKAAATVGAAVTTAAINVNVALAGGQSEGTGLTLGIDDGRETIALFGVFFAFFTLYYNWAKGQPDSDSDFFGEIDDRRA